MELPVGWEWKIDDDWETGHVQVCATDGECDVWVDQDGDLNIYGSRSAPGIVVAMVLLKSKTLTFTVERAP